MTAECKPFGGPRNPIWIIGHDPRLRKGLAEANTCFFLDRLSEGKEKQLSGAAVRQRRLAQGVIDYFGELADRKVALEELYVTNLCNRFLDNAPQGAAILIRDAEAARGFAAIDAALDVRGARPRVIVAMSQQVNYHLARLGFVDNGPVLEKFVRDSSPSPAWADRGGYKPRRPAAFLEICGRALRARGRLTVVPVLHISNWRRLSRESRYVAPMKRAARTIQECLR